MNSVFNQESHPTVCEFLRRGSRGAYLTEIANWPQRPGSVTFQECLESNLVLAKPLFIDDQIFCNHLTADKRELVIPRLSEVWLAAHLLRNSIVLQRVLEGTVEGQKTPDFRLAFGSRVFANLEIKRMSFPTVKQDAVQNASVPNHLEDSQPKSTDLAALVHYLVDPLQDDQLQLKRRLKNTVSGSRKQLAYRSIDDKGTLQKMLAWDIADSSDFQTLLILRSDEALADWVKQVATPTPSFDYMLLFATGIQRADIFFPRLLIF